jgi:hypothetical protein
MAGPQTVLVSIPGLAVLSRLAWNVLAYVGGGLARSLGAGTDTRAS